MGDVSHTSFFTISIDCYKASVCIRDPPRNCGTDFLAIFREITIYQFALSTTRKSAFTTEKSVSTTEKSVHNRKESANNRNESANNGKESVNN